MNPDHRPHAADVEAVADAWAAHRPVVITGPEGIGKTSLARSFAASLGRPPLWIIGTPAMRATPFGAFAAAIPVSLMPDAAAMVSELKSRIAAGAIVVVESAEHLDQASAAIVARLFTTVADAGLVTTADRLPEQLERDLATAGSRMIAVTPLDLAAVTLIVEARLGGPVEVSAVVRLHRSTGGNPFYLNQLLDGAVRGGNWTRTGGVWRLCADLTVTDDLHRASAERLGIATPEERQLIDLLSLCSPLPRDVVDHLGLAGGIGKAEGELVLPLNDVVVPGHAIFTEIRRAEMGTLERRRLVGALVEALGSGSSGPVARLHRSRLSLEYGLPLDPGYAESSTAAFLMGDMPLAERLAEAAVDRGAGLPALLQLSRARSAMGRADEAREVLVDVDPDSLDEEDLGGFAITLAINATVGGGDHPGAVAVLDKFEPRLVSRALCSAFAAVRALALVNDGQQFSALWWARRAQAQGGDVPLWTALSEYVEAEVLRRSGEVRRPIAMARTALALSQPLASLVGTGARRTLVQALLADGDLPAARHEAELLMEGTLLQHIPQAIACSTMAMVDIAAGGFSSARRHCESALRALGSDDRTGLGRGTAMQLAGICAFTGDVDGAKRALDLTVRATVSVHGWAGVNTRLAEAFVWIAEGEITRPAAVFHAAAAEYLATDQRRDALTVLHWAVRLGDRAAVTALIDAGVGAEGRLAALQRAHAVALRDGDRPGVRSTAEDFEELGFLPCAADSFAQSAAMCRSAGDRHGADRLLAAAGHVTQNCDGWSSPVMRAASYVPPLTLREFEVRSMADEGLTLDEMSARLGVTVATVRRAASHRGL